MKSPLILACALTACSPHVRRDPSQAPIPTPERFRGAVGEAATPTRWWTAFGDPGLEAVMDRALSQNLDLRQGWARLDQARLRAGQAGSARWPTLDASLSAGRNKALFRNPITGDVSSNEANAFGLSLAASYEVDLFGRIEAGVQAAEADVVALAFDQQALAMTLAASVAETWFALVEQRAQRTLLDAQIATNTTLLELLEFRFGEGLAGSVDVLQQRDQLRRTQAQLPLVEGRIQVLRNQLAVLMATTPGGLSVEAPATLPDPPALPATGLPAAVLGQRPDVRGAQARVAAADHRVGIALAQRYPALRLSASAGLQAQDLDALLDDWIWNIAGNLIAPLFDGGRRAAEVDLARAEVRARLLALAQAMLNAIREVEDALVQEARQREHLAQVDARLELLRRLLEDTRARYAEGVTDYLPVISAVNAIQAAEQARLGAHRQLISHRIQLYRALGGDWSKVVTPKGEKS